MSSEVDICNLALSHLGDEANVIAIRPPDGSIQAAHCGRFYPMARGVLLEQFAWSFAVKRVALAQVVNQQKDDWAYAYALPSTIIRPLSALSPGIPERYFGTDSDLGSHPYIVEVAQDGAAVLYTNVKTAVLRYIDLVTDPAKYSPGFVAALSRLLAAYLAGPLIKGKEGIRVSSEQLKWADLEFKKAASANANVGTRSAYDRRLPAFIAGRGGLALDPKADPNKL